MPKTNFVFIFWLLSAILRHYCFNALISFNDSNGKYYRVSHPRHQPLAGSRLKPDEKKLNTSSSRQIRTYRANWKGTRQWIGPHWWANPLYDWKLSKGAVIAAAASRRTLCFLPAEISTNRFDFTLRVTIKVRFRRLGSMNKQTIRRIAGGFNIGRASRDEDFRRAVIYPRGGLNAVLTADGYLILGRRSRSLSGEPVKANYRARIRTEKVVLTVTGKSAGSLAVITLSAELGKNGARRPTVVKSIVPKRLLKGGVSLLSSGPELDPTHKRDAYIKFEDFSFSTHPASFNEKRSFGPILWSQYTLHKKTLRLQAQLAPIEPNVVVELWVSKAKSRSPSQFRKIRASGIDKLSRTAKFTVSNWNSDRSVVYEVRVRWEGKIQKWRGVVRRDPQSRRRIKLAAFSCDFGYMFPLTRTVEQVRRQNPDMVFFLGDQIYETFGNYGVAWYTSTSISMLDFLYKYQRFGWTWRDVIKDRPSIIIPDDHDVFQENLWGAGGRSMRKPHVRKWEAGGYLMPGAWLRAVEKIHVGHLPNPAVEKTLSSGIKPYYTDLKYGGISFAILEDRKFKSAPDDIKRKSSKWKKNNKSGGELLGKEQERFVAKWARDWSDVKMKVAVSQSIFASATTHAGFNLRKMNYVEDTSAWPSKARSRVVKLLGEENVLTIHGDQHLGILIQQGVENFGDSGFAFMVPGVANGWPRAWWPNVSSASSVPRSMRDQNARFTGRHVDNSGNPLIVLAVANPQPFSNRLDFIGDSLNRVAYAKGSGYGFVVLDKKFKKAQINAFRVGGSTNEQFYGFPKTIRVGGKSERPVEKVIG